MKLTLKLLEMGAKCVYNNKEKTFYLLESNYTYMHIPANFGKQPAGFNRIHQGSWVSAVLGDNLTPDSLPE